ncbi:histidine kinase,HAMP domain-containing protein,histidine kinase [Thioflavicoccus mobilis 8321]|uniref:histidine kinase n=1 Tax=Thioflavicoccus mobilis 8321 TaxID=765912 RepID=L0H225_9GAMM|nr:ATP-binding protein [Thioflavicoccus mobilis]AGA92092.1 histidine kinase,HAMP domain-containing protein,histidine kinase [Thioflavicoccus mobilis 8321]
MTFSIRTKLFLIFLITSILVAASILGLMHWSFRQGLVELAETRQGNYLEEVAARLAEVYRRDGGWTELANDKGLWIAILKGRHHGPPDEPPEPLVDRPSDRPHAPLGEPGHNRRFGDDPLGVWPPEEALRPPPPGAPPLPLGLRLMLLDANGQIVWGRATLLDNARRYPVTVYGETVGTLALRPGPIISELEELRFLKRQKKTLLAIATGMVVLSAALALILARSLTHRLFGFQSTARQLAAGDYSARVATAGGDELGRLGADINALAEALELNEQARRQWVADISHELRTPLALLRAELEALQDGVRPLTPDSVDTLLTDTLRLGRLVDDLYELSMTDLGALSYRKELVEPSAIIEADVESFATRYTAAGLTLRLEQHLSEPVTLVADPHRLSQLFRNLLQNSLQYTDPGGRLTVVLRRDEQALICDFEDTAPGVPAESLAHLFDRLYRVDASRSRHTGGAGLGLAICQNIVAAHGGTIRARPSLGGGLWVQIRLPLRG